MLGNKTVKPLLSYAQSVPTDPIPEQHGDVDPAVLEAVTEMQTVGLVKKVGIEDHRTVAAVGNAQ